MSNPHADATITTNRIATIPPAVRRFYECREANGVRIWVVESSMGRALLRLGDLEIDADRIEVDELPETSARGIKIRGGDDSPADNLADAPMGAVYSTEV